MAKNLKANASAIASSKTQFVGTTGYETVTVKTSGYGSIIDKNVEKIIFNAKASSMTYKIDNKADTVAFFDKSKKLVAEISIDDTAQVVFSDKIINFTNDTVKNKISSSKIDNQHITINLDSALNAYKSTILPAFDKAIAEISKYITSFKNITYKVEKADLGSSVIATGGSFNVPTEDLKSKLNSNLKDAVVMTNIEYQMIAGEKYWYIKENFDYDGTIQIDVSKIDSISYKVIEHEVLHTIGLGELNQKLTSVFSSLIENSNGKNYFSGENAIKVNDGNVLLTDDKSHIDIKSDLMYPKIGDQTLSKLDFAILADMGVPVVGINFNNNDSLI